ncbi:Maf family protein, partial [Staphylococcus aureus]
AKQKLEAVREKVEGVRIILAADTIVVLKDEVLNKPANKEEAIAMLTKLSGKEHQVITGVIIYDPVTNKQHQFAETTTVRFHKLTD